MAEIDIEHRNIKGRQLLDVLCFLVCLFRFKIEKDDIRFLDDGGFYIDETAFMALEGGQLRERREFVEILSVGRGISFDQIVAPGDDTLKRVFLVERSDQIELAPFS